MSGSEDNDIKIWDIKQKRAIKTLRGHLGEVFSLAVLPNGNLASCSLDKTIKIWNPFYDQEKAFVGEFKNHDIDKCVDMLRVLSDEELVTCSNEGICDNSIRIWNVGDFTEKKIDTGSRIAQALTVLSKDSVAVGFNTGFIKIVEIRKGHIKHSIDCQVSVLSLASLPKGHFLGGFSKKNAQIKIWDEEGEQTDQISTGHKEGIFSLSTSIRGDIIASESRDRCIKVWVLQKFA